MAEAPAPFLWGRSLFCHRRRQAYSRNQARFAGLAGPSDVKGGAVVRRGTDQLEPEGDVDSTIKIQCLDRDQGLIVIHADRRIISAAKTRAEHRVR